MNIDDEGRLVALHNMSNPLLELNDFTPVLDNLKVLTFQSIRIMNQLLSTGQSIDRSAPLFNTMLHNSSTFLQNEQNTAIFSVFIDHVESLLSSIHDVHTRYCLSELMMGLYGSLSKINPSCKLYKDKSEEFIRKYNQIASECCPSDYESDNEIIFDS